MNAHRAQEPSKADVTRENIAAWVQAYVKDGMDPNTAFRQVFDDIERLGQLDDLARVVGPSLVGDVWRSKNKTLRPSNAHQEFREVVPTIPSDQPTPIVAPAARVVAIDSLKKDSLLDGMYKIDGQWISLRDMGKPECHRAFRQYRESAIAEEHNARYFRAIEAALDDGEVVGQRFDDEKLLKLYRTCKP